MPAALVLTACASTTAPSATDAPVRTVAVPTLPPAPAALLVAPERPAPPVSGRAADILSHAAEFGAYVGRLELQNQGWRDWYRAQGTEGK